jgi:hypothetical protein
MGFPMKYSKVIGVRLPRDTKRKAAKYASALCVPEASFIRILVNLGLQQVEENPEILLKRLSSVGFSG